MDVFVLDMFANLVSVSFSAVETSLAAAAMLELESDMLLFRSVPCTTLCRCLGVLSLRGRVISSFILISFAAKVVCEIPSSFFVRYYADFRSISGLLQTPLSHTGSTPENAPSGLIVLYYKMLNYCSKSIYVVNHLRFRIYMITAVNELYLL